EARDVIDVPMRVVPNATLAEPNGLPDSQVLIEETLVSVACESGVALLYDGQQAFLGDEERPLAIGIDGAALEHDTVARVLAQGLDASEAGDPGNFFADAGVAREVVVLGPGVEAPIGEDDLAPVIEHGRGRRVAQPDAIVRHEVK